VADPARAEFFAKLNGVFSSVPEAWPEVTYLDPAEALGPSGAGFADVVTLPDGTAIRLRQVDGLHLCPSGAQLLAELVVDDVATPADLPVADGWQEGSWRVNEGLYPGAGCPSPVTP
jgi:hypothetical protein